MFHSRFPRARGWLLAPLAALLLSACGGQMANTPRYEPYEESSFFADGSSARQPVADTVPRGHLQDDELLLTGSEAPAEEGGQAAPATVYPMEVTREMILRGQERFNINCAPCHGMTGEGDGMVVRAGYRQPQTFHQDRLRESPPGYFVGVITNGFGQMPPYAGQVAVEDRWAIAAYIQVLQASQNGTAGDVPAGSEILPFGSGMPSEAVEEGH